MLKPENLKKFLIICTLGLIILPFLSHEIVTSTQSSKVISYEEIDKVVIYNKNNILTKMELDKYKGKKIFIVSDEILLLDRNEATLIIVDDLNLNCGEEISQIDTEIILVADSNYIHPLAYSCKSRGILLHIDSIWSPDIAYSSKVINSTRTFLSSLF